MKKCWLGEKKLVLRCRRRSSTTVLCREFTCSYDFLSWLRKLWWGLLQDARQGLLGHWRLLGRWTAELLIARQRLLGRWRLLGRGTAELPIARQGLLGRWRLLGRGTAELLIARQGLLGR